SYDSRDPAKSTNGQYDPAKFQWHGDSHSNSPLGTGDSWHKAIYGNLTTNEGNVAPGGGVHGTVNNHAYIDMPPVQTPSWTQIVATPTTVTSNTTITAGTSSSPPNYKLGAISGALTIQSPLNSNG